MKLLSRTSVADKKRQETDARLIESQKLNAQISREYAELAKIREEKTTKIAVVNSKLAKAENEYGERIGALENEVSILEARRKVAMKPIKEERDELNKEKRELAKATQALELNELSLQALTRDLEQSKEDILAIKDYVENEKAAVKAKQNKARKSIAEAVSKIKEAAEGLESLEEERAKFQEEKQEQAKEITRLQSQANATLKAAKTVEKKNEVEMTRIRSEKETLKTAFDEARKKNIL